MKSTKKHTKIGKAIIAGLSEAIEHEEGKISLRQTSFTLPSPAPKFSKSKVKKLREEVLHISQPIFASLLNVSPSTIKAWEQGAKSPSGAAMRLLQLISKKPKILEDLRT